MNEIDEPQSKEDYINKGSDSVSNSPNAAAEKIEILRKKARRDARERVSTSATTRQTTQQYTRSQAIKEYVKTRANGYCEGCGEPAPFISKTDDPYLHAHHIQELSEGGSDTLDTVVALCPNCHYHVHHGKDGEDYNQQLLEIVQDIEKESVN